MRTVIIDSQILTKIQQCAARTNYTHNLHLRLPEKSAALQRGSLIHNFLGGMYEGRMKSGNKADFLSCANAALPISKAYAATLSLPDHDINNVFKSLEQYVELYKFEPMEVLIVEAPFAFTLYESEEEDLRIVYVGITDLIAKDRDSEPKVYDHKSQSRKSDFLVLDDQFEGYSVAASTNVLYVNVVGLQVSVPVAEKMRRVPLSYPATLLERWKKHVVYWVKQYLVYTDNNEWPENHTSCNKFQLCEYYMLCTSVTDEARAWKIQTEYTVGEPWDPTKVLANRE